MTTGKTKAYCSPPIHTMQRLMEISARLLMEFSNNKWFGYLVASHFPPEECYAGAVVLEDLMKEREGKGGGEGR